MYEYVNKEDRQELTFACEKIIKSVQKELREYFTFDIKLIGSGEKRLITRNGKDGSFDLDYNLILQRDKKGLFNYPEEIKNLFLNSFSNYNPKYGFKAAQNSSSVVTSRLIYQDRLTFSFDIAILIEGNNGNYYKLIFDKHNRRYIWNELRKSKNFTKKYKHIKDNGHFPKFRDRYLELKNMHLRRQDGVKSFSIFLETLNEFY